MKGTRSLIIVRAYFTPEVISDAGILSGLSGSSMSDVACTCLWNHRDCHIACSDLGGGCRRNISLTDGALKAHGGDMSGGDDWDSRVMEWLADQSNVCSIDLRDRMATQRLKEAAELIEHDHQHEHSLVHSDIRVASDLIFARARSCADLDRLPEITLTAASDAVCAGDHAACWRSRRSRRWREGRRGCAIHFRSAAGRHIADVTGVLPM